MTIEQQREAKAEIGKTLIFLLFKCVSSDYKKKYARDIWTQFENALRMAAYTSSFPIFIENFCKKMPNDYYQNSELMGVVQDITNAYSERQILEWIRQSTTYLVTVARVKNDELKSEFAARQEVKKTTEKPSKKETVSINIFTEQGIA